MLELANRFGAGEPVRVRTIADRHRIPARFLVQILLQLKGAGLVASTRGASGGYELSRAPRDITLAEILDVVSGRGSGGNVPESPWSLALASVWSEVAAAEHRALESVTLADLLKRAEHTVQHMYHI